MGDPLIQLTDPSNWEQSYENTFYAEALPNGRFYPINPLILPVLFTSPYLALGASSTDARSHWKLGYWIKQFIAPASVGFGAVETNSARGYLNRTAVARFPLYAPQYQLRIEFPWWHRSMDVSIWEYVGDSDDTTEALIRDQTDAIRASLATIEAKIDAL